MVLTAEEEQQLVSYTIQMQDLGFGLTATDVRKQAYEIAAKSGRQNTFQAKDGSAGWDWWVSFKKRYGLTMRTPENLSVNRAEAANKDNIREFHDLLESTIKKYDLQNEPSRIWNMDESGFSFVTKPGKVVSPKGRKRIYQQVTGERGETTTVLPTVNAAGQAGPYLIIFKGQRLAEELKGNTPPNAMVTVSANGWIESDIFLQFLRFFVERIPPARPQIILLDSHASHVSVDAMKFREENGLVFLTFPAHTTHLLQPLDVSVFGPMKANWRKKVKDFLQVNGRKPSRRDFFPIFTSVFQESMTIKNICSGFRAAGIYPFSKDALPEDVYHPGALHSANDNAVSASVMPAPQQFSGVRQRKSAAQKARVFDNMASTSASPNSNNEADSGLPAREVEETTVKRNRQRKERASSSNSCKTCERDFKVDRDGESWIQCTGCLSWYHEACQ